MLQRFLLLIILLLAIIKTPAHAGITFDGTDDAALTTGTPALLVGGSGTAFTLAFWVNPTTSPPSPEGMPISNAGNPTPSSQYNVRHQTDGSVTFFWCTSGCANQGWITTTATNLLPANTWTHIAWVVTNALAITNSTVYFNGTSQAYSVTVNTSASTTTAFGNTAFGREGDWTSSEWFKGKLDEVVLYNVALTANEVATMASSKLRGPALTRSPVGYWPMNHCAEGVSVDGQVFNDRSSGTAHPVTADNGANNTGLTCTLSSGLTMPWGAQ